MTLTPTDKTLLDALQRCARPGLEALAAKTGLSVASVQRRLKAFKADGLITGEVALVDPAKVGQAMSFVVMVELERERPDQIDAFIRKIQGETQVQQCYYVTGEADFCLICLARDMADFEALTGRLFFEDANVRRFRTSVVMRRGKISMEVPIITSEET